MAVRTDAKGRHRVEFQQGGRRILRRCPPGTTKEQARLYEGELRRNLFAESALGQKPVVTLAAAIQLWLEHTLPEKKDQRMPKQNALHLAPYVKGKTVLQAPEAAQEARTAWQGVLAPATINRRLAVLKAASRYAWRQGWIEANVSGRIGKLREPAGRRVYLSAAEVKALTKAAKQPRAKAAIMILAYSGLRCGELLALPKLARNATHLPVRDSKTGEHRDVPIVAPLRPYLKHLPLGVAYRTLWDWFNAARAVTGLAVRPHDLRHTTASLLANAGVDLYVIGKILGHKAPATTARYAHLTDRTVARAMRKIA